VIATWAFFAGAVFGAAVALALLIYFTAGMRE
jgi:hypothetical protein